MKSFSKYLIVAALAFSAGMVSASVLNRLDTSDKSVNNTSIKMDSLGNSTGVKD